MSAQHTPGPLTVRNLTDSDARQFSIESDWRFNDGSFEDRYVCFSGFFGSYGPHVFAAAPDLLEALEELEALGSLDLPHRRGAALVKAKAVIAKARNAP